MTDNTFHYHGHRNRLKQRFTQGQGDGMQDYEILELVLTYAIPRQDVKPIAKALLKEFKTIPALIGADTYKLTKIKGVGMNTAILIKAIQRMAILGAKTELTKGHILNNWDKLIEYCTLHMGHSPIEEFRVVFLNTRNRVILDEVQTRGTINETGIYPREIVRRAIEIGASSIILVHNHPSGDATPSRADIEMTKQVQDTCNVLNIRLHDHIIIGKENVVSFKSLYLL